MAKIVKLPFRSPLTREEDDWKLQVARTGETRYLTMLRNGIELKLPLPRQALPDMPDPLDNT